MKEGPESRDYMKEFMENLNREERPSTKIMQKGIDFEDLITDIINGSANTKKATYKAASEIADIIGGGALQYPASKEIEIDGIPILLYGRLDALKAGTIYDIKFSGVYERGKYIGSTQHPTYLEIVPEAHRFIYLVSDGKRVWSEEYRRDEVQDIRPVISDFLGWLKAHDLFELYTEKWKSYERQTERPDLRPQWGAVYNHHNL